MKFDPKNTTTTPSFLSEGTTITQESNVSNQQQPQWMQIVRSILLLAPAVISSLLALFCLSVPLWGPWFIVADPLDTPYCIPTVTVILPIIISLMCLALVAMNAFGFRHERAGYFGCAGCVGACLAVFALCTPVWAWFFVWGDSYEGTGTVCEILLGNWFTLVGFLVGLALVILNLVALAAFTYLRR